MASLHNNFGNLETILEESEVEDSVVEPQRQGVECLNMVNIPSRPEGDYFVILMFFLCLFVVVFVIMI